MWGKQFCHFWETQPSPPQVRMLCPTLSFTCCGQGYSAITLFFLFLTLQIYKQNPFHIDIRGGADKSLAWPGRKHATATKLGIYSTYSPQSSIHFLACCSNFCKPPKKKFKSCPSNQVFTAEMTLLAGVT